jgi:hypothetical protein
MTTKYKTLAILISAVLFSLVSCNRKPEPVWSDLPEVTSLENLKETDFVITLENPIFENKNIIYAPAFLYAWDKIKDALKFPIIVNDTNSTDFNLLNKSITHKNSLTNTEYSATAEVVDGAIIARAFFNKTLPFETKLQAIEAPIHFNTTKVLGFGMYFYDEEVIKFTQILYYKDNDHFILKLIPKDKQHEIILAKGLDTYQTLKDAITITNSLITAGKQEQKNNNQFWKYQIVHEDQFAIPVIKFNIATHYKSLEGKSFSTNDNTKRTIEEAYQRTGFIFNENGAVVESEAAVVVTDSASAAPINHPKKMIFDKPFFIIIKRADKKNPYFVMKVANAELLIKK